MPVPIWHLICILFGANLVSCSLKKYAGTASSNGANRDEFSEHIGTKAVLSANN